MHGDPPRMSTELPRPQWEVRFPRACSVQAKKVDELLHSKRRLRRHSEHLHPWTDRLDVC